MKNYRTLTISLIAAWFLLALGVSALGGFRNDSNRLGVAVAVGALMPIVIFSLWFGISKGFRQFALSLSPAALTSAQAWRIAGFTFVLLEAHGLLPGLFAFPAGFGDMAIGATAFLVAWKVANADHRNLFIAWQVLGIIDLVTAVSLGATAGLLIPDSIPMVPMTILPLSLVPTFLVPLFMIFHIICIVQARSWEVASKPTGQLSGPLQHSAG
jgi:hypothetical protein